MKRLIPAGPYTAANSAVLVSGRATPVSMHFPVATAGCVRTARPGAASVGRLTQHS
jgi:hypothetical protein